jgi:hypothetical protein
VPKQYGLEGFAIVLFCASLAMTLMVGACFFRVCVFSHTWFPDIWAGVSWIAACISAHTRGIENDGGAVQGSTQPCE